MRISNLIAPLLVTFAAAAPSAGKKDSVVNYPLAPIYSKSEVFSVKGNDVDIDAIHFYEDYDYTHFAMGDSPVEFTITTNETVESVNISPNKLKIKTETDGKSFKFSLDKPEYLIIKVNELKELVFMADELETDVPDPEKSLNVKDYGADGSDKDHVTQGIQKALDAAKKKPGSTVYVPEGVYYTGNLVIPSDTELYLAPGSVVKFTGNASDYERKYTKDALHGSNGTWFISTEFDSENIKVYGRGTIDGTGNYSQLESKFIAMMLTPIGTKHFTFDGPLFVDGGFWTVVPTQSEDVHFKNLKIANRFPLGQNDGIDFCEVRNGSVKRSIGISADDPYSTKTWDTTTDIAEMFPYDPQPLKDIAMEDCLSWTKTYGFKVGQGVTQTQDNVLAKNFVVYDSGVGCGIDHSYGKATSKNLRFENFYIEHLAGAPGGQKGWLSLVIKYGDERGVGNVTDVTVKDFYVHSLGSGPGSIRGYRSPDAMIDGVTIEGIYMFDNTTAATTLEEMNILDVSLAENIEIKK